MCLRVGVRIFQLDALDAMHAKVQQALGLTGRALDVVRVPGKRDEKLAEAKTHLENALTLHEAMLQGTHTYSQKPAVHSFYIAKILGR
jgi:hypothetical protein